MEEYYQRCQIPAFGSWDCYDGLPFTECFETGRQTGFIHYSYPEDEDLYVTGDLYANDVVTPAMIIVPRQKRKENDMEDDGKEGKGKGWVVGDFKEQQSPTFARRRPTPKPVDEDLYKISPDLFAKTNKKHKRGLSFFACWMLPNCGF